MTETACYIEIFHMSPNEMDWYLSYPDSESARVAREIQALTASGQEVHFVEPSNLFIDQLPHIDKSTPIRLGGGTASICVPERAKALRNAGFENVTIDPKLTMQL